MLRALGTRRGEDLHDDAVHATSVSVAMAIDPLLEKRCMNAMGNSPQAGGSEAGAKIRESLSLALVEICVQAAQSCSDCLTLISS